MATGKGQTGERPQTGVEQRSRDERQHVHTVHLAVRHSARSAAAGSGPAVLCGQNSTGVVLFMWESGGGEVWGQEVGAGVC